jgi:hypothetical protein
MGLELDPLVVRPVIERSGRHVPVLMLEPHDKR